MKKLLMNQSKEEISTVSQTAAKIVKPIDEITFQNNLPGFNAVVETARTGEVGAEFAVVGEEVRKFSI